jgi:hypothetical protein
LQAARNELDKTDKGYKLEDVVEEATNIFIKLTKANENEPVEQHRKNHQGFIDRNCIRWGAGLDQLELLYITSQEAALNFQEHYLSIPKLENDPLLGVLMRLHANALRITSEIIHLIKGGYADGALARWRSLFEISVTSLIIHKYGRQAAIDYIKHGNIKTVEGIEEYQKTAEKMNLEPYTNDEIEQAVALKATLSEGDSYWHWARNHTGFSKLEKLREHVGLDHWSHNYKLASRNIHADYSEMRSLLGMEEATEDLLLVGQSNSGMTLPAHITSIMLNQITSCFLTAYINEETDLDYTNSMVFMNLLKKYSDNVGEEFLKCQGLES